MVRLSYIHRRMEVVCESYDYPEDPYILDGSCGVSIFMIYNFILLIKIISLLIFHVHCAAWVHNWTDPPFDIWSDFGCFIIFADHYRSCFMLQLSFWLRRVSTLSRVAFRRVIQGHRWHFKIFDYSTLYGIIILVSYLQLHCMWTYKHSYLLFSFRSCKYATTLKIRWKINPDYNFWFLNIMLIKIKLICRGFWSLRLLTKCLRI